MTESITIGDLFTIKQFAAKYPAFPQGTLRAFVFNANKNGFLPVIRRVGGKVLLKESAFFEWVESLNQEKGA